MAKKIRDARPTEKDDLLREVADRLNRDHDKHARYYGGVVEVWRKTDKANVYYRLEADRRI